MLGCHSKPPQPIRRWGQEWDRCPVALWRDMPEDDRATINTIIELVTAKRQGSLSPFPGSYCGAALELISECEEGLCQWEKWAWTDEGQRYVK